MNMDQTNIIFFGSTAESVIVLEKLSAYGDSRLAAAVTQPPRPAGRHGELTPTPVDSWAKSHNIPVLSFPSDKQKPWLYENEQTVVDALQPFKADLLISASYGQKIPTQTIQSARFGGLNVHPSLLPRWRGADPVPWAILSGDAQTGVTILTLAEKFDEGKIIAQKKIPIFPTDTTTLLYPKLFALGADLFVKILPEYLSEKNKETPQVPSQPTPGVEQLYTSGISSYARRLTRDDGFEPWQNLQKAIHTGNEADRIDRKFRALDPWPGLWSTILIKNQKKRLKILKLHLQEDKLILDEVQLESKKPTSYRQFLR